MVFYDNHGEPTAYTEDGVHIYLFSGEPVAYLDHDAIYGYNGRQFGWFDNGWMRDLNGDCVFFSEKATRSGPVKPVKHICPIKCIKEIRRVRAVNRLGWSQLSGIEFFKQ